jgi:hypothetical protein
MDEGAGFPANGLTTILFPLSFEALASVRCNLAADSAQLGDEIFFPRQYALEHDHVLVDQSRIETGGHGRWVTCH